MFNLKYPLIIKTCGNDYIQAETQNIWEKIYDGKEIPYVAAWVPNYVLFPLSLRLYGVDVPVAKFHTLWVQATTSL